jgi:hypothetical protein
MVTGHPHASAGAGRHERASLPSSGRCRTCGEPSGATLWAARGRFAAGLAARRRSDSAFARVPGQDSATQPTWPVTTDHPIPNRNSSAPSTRLSNASPVCTGFAPRLHSETMQRDPRASRILGRPLARTGRECSAASHRQEAEFVCPIPEDGSRELSLIILSEQVVPSGTAI